MKINALQALTCYWRVAATPNVFQKLRKPFYTFESRDYHACSSFYLAPLPSPWYIFLASEQK
jgi:hypothetical protein